jgi:hypothetical protein
LVASLRASLFPLLTDGRTRPAALRRIEILTAFNDSRFFLV